MLVSFIGYGVSKNNRNMVLHIDKSYVLRERAETANDNKIPNSYRKHKSER
jgi:hypothetical protein